MGKLNNTYGFGAFVNVDIRHINKETGTIKKHIQKHNKATRNMVKGLLRFLEGKFTPTYENAEAEHGSDAKNYIPCYISLGDGGITYGDDGKPVEIHTDEQSVHIPDFSNSNWDTKVDYNSNSLVREYELLSEHRSKVRKQEDTIDLANAPAGDMDTVVLYCEIAPGEINTDIHDSLNERYPRYVTEIGLFSSPSKRENDLLAYVKLGNIVEDDEITGTDALYVRPGDTVVITWFITIVAMSDISVVDSSEELLEPEIGQVNMEILDSED